ncbi:MAG: autotransporter-associated beta strand repeat-containing protein, partial [Rhodanobacter sp.]
MAGSITGDVKNNGALVFNRSGDPVFYGVFSGAISGSGSLTKSGADTLTLTGANTYSGGTTIASGTLQIGKYGLMGSIVGNVVNNGSLVFGRLDNVSFDGIVSGTGTLVKTGDGSLTLSGANTFSGGTFVQGGTLKVAPGAALGSGDITVGLIGPYYFNDHILQIASGVSLSNHIELKDFGTLDNAGALVSTLDNAVSGSDVVVVLNHDGGNIKGKDSAIAVDVRG